MDRSAYDLPRLLDEYADRPAVLTARELLLAAPRVTGEDLPLVRFLLGRDLAELGLSEAASRELRAVLPSETLGGQAFLALARILNETGESEALVAEARTARWSQLARDDFGEAVFLVARACMATKRYAEARDWLRQVPPSSDSFSYSRFLLVQTEYALGRSDEALDAAAAVFDLRPRSEDDRWLRERTALLVGDMLIDLGLYEHAIDVLEWPSSKSPFRARADRDITIARTMMSVASGRPASAAFERDGERYDGEIAAAVGSHAEAVARAADLEKVWPPRGLWRARRVAAARAAREAYASVHGGALRRIGQAIWKSLPPVVFLDLARHPAEAAAEPAPALASKTRHFFTPRGEVSKLLVAVALASEAPSGDDCSARFARVVAERAATSSLDGAHAPTSEELHALAAGCADGDAKTRLAPLRAALARAIGSEADRLRREIREQRYRVEEAVVAAEFVRSRTIDAEQGERLP